MTATIRIIEEALHQMYSINTPFRAENFLITKPHNTSESLQGALCVRHGSFMEVGIYLDPAILDSLSHLPMNDNISRWPTHQLNAFSIAAEEISHFHYLLFHAANNRPVSQLELEIQGEIDRFLLCFFSDPNPESIIENLIERLFDRFRLREHLSTEESRRYTRANGLAKNFVIKHVKKMTQPSHRDRLLRFVRRFYRLAEQEKLIIAGKS